MRDVLLQIADILDTINENISDETPETEVAPVVAQTRSRKRLLNNGGINK